MNDSQNIEIATAMLALMKAGKVGSSRLVEAMRDWARAPEGAPGDLQSAISAFDLSVAEVNASLAVTRRAVEKGLELGVIPIPFSSELYPGSLRHIADAPPVLFVRGRIGVLSELPGVAVVGTRKASQHGLTIARRIAAHLSNSEWVVVSGLALGIDAAAHEGALSGKDATIAVLAHGLERASPRTNEPLAMRILDAGGLWVSEHPVGVPARPEHFVHRNRIQVGLSAASVIVEGELKSGSMTQAEYCLRYGRELFAVLPDPEVVSTQSELPRMLVRQRGARPIASRESYSELLAVAERKASELAELDRI